MSLSLGIVGLPNVGKSTLFNALTRSKLAAAENYPFCTIEPNVGIVEVPDERLPQLAVVSKSKKVVPTAIKFVDIAGLVKGASEGEGLGNQFLSHIREVDAIVQVVRAFADPNVTHVHNKVDPRADVDVINLELVLADLQTVAKRLENVKKKGKGKIETGNWKPALPARFAARRAGRLEIELLERLSRELEAGHSARELIYTDDELTIMKELQLLTMKPMLYVVNVTEQGTLNKEQFGFDPARTIAVCAKLEAELAELSLEEAKEYMKQIGMEESGLDKIITAGYKLLNLITYFTSGEPETRAWTVPAGTLAPLAAGVIHTDFIKGFIKADVCGWQDFVTLGGWSGARDKGKLRIEGKEYVVQDGDVVYFHVN